MDVIKFDVAANELSAEEVIVGISELGDMQLALIGGGIGDTQL